MPCSEKVLMLMKCAATQLKKKKDDPHNNTTSHGVCSKRFVCSHQAGVVTSSPLIMGKTDPVLTSNTFVRMDNPTATERTKTSGAALLAIFIITDGFVELALDNRLVSQPEIALSPANPPAVWYLYVASRIPPGISNTSAQAPSQQTQNNSIQPDDRAIHSRSSSAKTRLESPTKTVIPKSSANKSSGGAMLTYCGQVVGGNT